MLKPVIDLEKIMKQELELYGKLYSLEDDKSEAIIQRSLEKLSKDRTTIVVAHRLSTIKNADNIVVLTQKGIEEEGTHDKLMKNNHIYTKLYNAQFKGYMPDAV